jgi:hypothetical protein
MIMADKDHEKDTAVPAKPAVVTEKQDDRMEDEEKILAGRNDVNYPALLTKDVPGG